MMAKEQYINLLERIFYKYNLSDSFLEATYKDAIKSNDLTCCYVDSRIKNSKKLRKELDEIVKNFLKDYPEAIRPLYSYNIDNDDIEI
jgi:aspartyl/asparaginyl-tRNA synthetase